MLYIKLNNNYNARFIFLVISAMILGFLAGGNFKSLYLEDDIDEGKAISLVFIVNSDDGKKEIGSVNVNTEEETLGEVIDELNDSEEWDIDLGGDKGSGNGRIINGVNEYKTITQEIDPWWVYTSSTAVIPNGLDDTADYKDGVNFFIDLQEVSDGDEFVFEYKLFDGEL